MQTAQRRRTSGAIVVSVIAHLAVGVVILLQRTTLVIPPGERGPPEAIIPILIVPKAPPTASGKLAQPTPIRLHRRPQPFLPPDVPAAPIAPPAPPAPPSTPAPARGPVVLHPSPLPEGPKGDVRTALRQGFVGCANSQAVGLNRAERDLCDEKFGKGAKDTAFAGLGLSPDKQRLLDGAAARKESQYRYKYSNTPNGSNLSGSHTMGVDGIGATAHGMADGLANDKPDLPL